MRCTLRAAADFSRVTDRQTDRLTDGQADIGKNSQHLMHLMPPKNTKYDNITKDKHHAI